MPPPSKPHLNVTRFLKLKDYQYPRGGSPKIPFSRANPTEHGEKIRKDLQELQAHEKDDDTLNIRLECELNILDALKSLDGNRGKFELLQVTQNGKIINVIIRLNKGGLKVLETKIKEYLEKTTIKGLPKNALLLNAIRSIRKATVQTLWTESLPFPTETQPIWWEGWLLRDKDTAASSKILESFTAVCRDNGLDFFTEPKLRFAERTLVYFKATPNQLSEISGLLHDMAELHKPAFLPTLFDNMPPSEQREWTDELSQRTLLSSPNAPIVGLLDTGVMHTHPLLQKLISAQDCLVITGETANDLQNHGTGMASLIFFGEELPALLAGNQPIQVPAKIRSVKIIPDRPHTGDISIEKTLATLRTAQGIATLEENASQVQTICFANTLHDSPSDSTPDAWSSLLDKQAFASEERQKSSRLFFISGGNIREQTVIKNYPNQRDCPEATIETPAQAWNVITVGGITNLDTPAADIPLPIARAGSLSPLARTGLAWQDKKSLIKPEIVFEAGNVDRQSGLDHENWKLLVANASPERLFGLMSGTSPATALAARFHAQLAEIYPRYSQELLRALIIHSAEWPSAMKITTTRKDERIKIARKIGYGVPDLQRAISCSENRTTLIIESELQPFSENGNSPPKLKEMALLDLGKWPITEVLRKNPNADFQMRVTLSYFIEPNPGNRSYKNEYSYASHQLRFDVNQKNESRDAFLKRINKAAINEETEPPENHLEAEKDSDQWFFGPKSPMRTAGSIHTDIWDGSAADMLNARYIAIYPTKGWWKSRAKLNRYNSKTKFALVVTFKTIEGIDIYTPLATLIQIPPQISVDIS
jgi:hypothetical protein